MKIAIVEDDINMRKSLELSLAKVDDFEVTSFKNPKEALKKIDDSFDLVVTDLTMPGMDGIELLKRLDGRFESIVITGNATLNKSIDAMRLGAKDFLVKPFEIDTLIAAIKRSQKISTKLKKPSNKKSNTSFGFVSQALKTPLNVAKRAAMTDASCLLLGESGVGKEVFANFIHKSSPRSNKDFVAINMAAIPETLIEAELFGYEKGAFTGADTPKAGKFEEAHKGTLFLDEIGEMPYSLQAKLLRVLQEKEITRLGSAKKIKVDVRIISATNINIENSIIEGSFREDLYYRLNTIPILIPPLRERKEEILPIAKEILSKICAQYELEAKTFSSEAEQELLRYQWPGNVRELISVCERAAILSEQKAITKEDLFIQARQRAKNIESMEKELLQTAIAQTDFNKQEIAKILSIDLAELEKKLKKYQLGEGK